MYTCSPINHSPSPQIVIRVIRDAAQKRSTLVTSEAFVLDVMERLRLSQDEGDRSSRFGRTIVTTIQTLREGVR